MKNTLILFVLTTLSTIPVNAQFTSSNLPIIIINTNGQTIPNTTKITADMKVIWNGDGQRNNITDPPNHYNGKIGIELRGSSSQSFPKKGYAVETRDSAGENLNVELMGFPAENDWVFNATYNDKSLMRDVLVYDAARKTGRYASRSRYFELVVNGDYKGLYILFEKIKRDKNRVAIKGMEITDTSGVALTGGYIVKIDKLDGEDIGGWNSPFLPFPGAHKPIFYQYHEPKNSKIVPEQKNYIHQFITNFETVMNSSNFADTAVGFPKIANDTSFVDYFLINEFAKNVDGYRLSTFMYKDRDNKDPKLYMGPVWDFNIALGNADYYDGWKTTGWELDFLTTDSYFLQNDAYFVPTWWKKLFAWDHFKSLIKQRWAVLLQTSFNKDRIYSVIDSLTDYLSEARTRNFQRWPVLGVYVWPNYFIGTTYQQEIDYLKSWITTRIQWMSSAINGFTDVQTEQPVIPQSLEVANYPNPFNPTTTIKYSLPSSGNVVIKIYDSQGSLISTLFSGEASAGSHEIKVDAEKLHLSSGFYPVTVSFIENETTGIPAQTGVVKLLLIK